jgi:osmotically-inducible protein OsmY
VWRLAGIALSVSLGAGALSGCGVLLLGGAAVGGTLIATDRRTSGSQLEDQAIEFKARSRLKAAVGDRGHLNITSYNRVVLITGEASSEADRAAVEQAMSRIEGVKSVVNEVVEKPNSSLAERSSDAILSTKVKATLFDAKGTLANAYKVVVERKVVYLMGRVTDVESGSIADLASSVPGVDKVVRVFEILSDEELKDLRSR